MAASLKLLPGSTVRWRGRRYLIVDYESLDAIIARQPGKRRLAGLSLLEGSSTREGAPNAHRDQKVCTTGAMFYFRSKGFRRGLMRGGGWAGSVSLSCSSRILCSGYG